MTKTNLFNRMDMLYRKKDNDDSFDIFDPLKTPSSSPKLASSSPKLNGSSNDVVIQINPVGDEGSNRSSVQRGVLLEPLTLSFSPVEIEMSASPVLIAQPVPPSNADADTKKIINAGLMAATQRVRQVVTDSMSPQGSSALANPRELLAEQGDVFSLRSPGGSRGMTSGSPLGERLRTIVSI